MSDEKIFRLKTKEGDSQSGYLEEKIWGSDYVTITEEEGASGKRLKIEIDTEAIGGEVVTGKAKVSSSDTAAYLENQFAAGDGIDVSSNGSIITISLDASLPDLNDVDDDLSPSNRDILVYSGDQSEFEASFNIEETFSGTEDHVPSSDAISDLLHTLTVTNDADLGSGGNAIMYEKEDIDAARIMYVGISDATASNIIDTTSSHYPLSAALVAQNAKFVTGENTDRGVFGNVNIITEETPAASDPYLYAALINFNLNENYISGDTVYLDVMFKLADSDGSDRESNIRAYPFYVKDGDSSGTGISTVDKTLSWNENGNDTYEWHTFAITGPTSDTKPIPMAVFIACMSEDGSYTKTPVESACIVSARVRYKKKTLELPTTLVTL